MRLRRPTTIMKQTRCLVPRPLLLLAHLPPPSSTPPSISAHCEPLPQRRRGPPFIGKKSILTLRLVPIIMLQFMTMSSHHNPRSTPPSPFPALMESSISSPSFSLSSPYFQYASPPLQLFMNDLSNMLSESFQQFAFYMQTHLHSIFANYHENASRSLEFPGMQTRGNEFRYF